MSQLPQDEYEYRCDECKRLLFKGNIVNGKVEIKCRCGHTNAVNTGIKHQVEKLTAVLGIGRLAGSKTR